MIKLEKKHIKIFSIFIAVVFIGSCVAIGVSQMGSTGVASAASSAVGKIDYRQAMAQSPDLQAANDQMQQAVEDAKKDFEEKSAGMSDQEKQDYYQQTQSRLQDLIEPIQKKIEEQVKAVAEAKGLSVVLDSNAVVYGGQDITQDVIRKLSK